LLEDTYEVVDGRLKRCRRGGVAHREGWDESWLLRCGVMGFCHVEVFAQRMEIYLYKAGRRERLGGLGKQGTQGRCLRSAF